MVYHGMEGESWDLSPEGFPILRPEMQTQTSPVRGNYYFLLNIVPPSHDKGLFTKARYKARELTYGYKTVPFHPVGNFVNDTDREYTTAVRTIEREYFWKVVSGEWDLDRTWDAYVKRWLDAGGQKILDAKKAQAKQLGL
jgi:hypothetical protein